MKKFRETLFTFKLHSAELLSFWRDFSHEIQNSDFIEILKKNRETLFTFKLLSF